MFNLLVQTHNVLSFFKLNQEKTKLSSETTSNNREKFFMALGLTYLPLNKNQCTLMVTWLFIIENF